MTIQQNIVTHTFETPFGKILGLRENGVIRVKNIRYARSERFKKPVPVQTADFEISDKIPVCPQHVSPFLERLIGKTDVNQFISDESPQFLTITRPEIMMKTKGFLWLYGFMEVRMKLEVEICRLQILRFGCKNSILWLWR
ncbi:hypothetical protein ACFOEQ_13730 [Chryseobacterium arachidis]|uniref:hypothetical protein n=1 Tax=Chryseobacterium arachidis TaxID=1416778 RepID=UPI003612E76C